MKYPKLIILVAATAAAMASCSRNNDYTPGLDHTKGSVKVHKWSGSTDGVALFDSVYYDSVEARNKTIKWVKVYNRTITDSTFALERINDFTLKALGHWMRYRTTDNIAKTVYFDTTYGSAALSYVLHYSNLDSINLEIHRLYNKHEATGVYEQDHWRLHTVD